MTPEQLQKTRAARWRQDGNALVTLEAAEEWLEPLGLCLFVPRRVQLPTPAPSFVEACLGEANAAPAHAAIETATALLSRLIDKGSVIPLNLLGISGEQPDFLATAEALPHVFALRGDKDWKHEPQTAGNGRVSPLVHGIWKALERTGVQTAVELRESMGKELTEAAVLRGLSELWNAMRVMMLPGEGGEAATWELLKARYQKQMAAGSAMSQVSALSVLLAQYLESAVGATSEEAEIFLSPLSSRSKVREVVRGLTATRQLGMIGLDGQAVLYVEGTLPEFEQPESQVTIEALAGDSAEASENAATGSIAAGMKAPGAEVNAPGAGTKRIRKFTKRASLAPGEADPLRWKRDSSVPPPAGQRRGQRSDSRGAHSAGGDSSRPHLPQRERSRPNSLRRDSEGRDSEGRDSGGRDSGGFDRRSRPKLPASPERPMRPLPKETGGFSAGSGQPPPSPKPSVARSYGKGAFQRPQKGERGAPTRDRTPGNYPRKARWEPREGSGADRSGGRSPHRGGANTGLSAASRSSAPDGPRPFDKPGFDKPGFNKPGFKKGVLKKGVFKKPGFNKSGAGGFKPSTDRAVSSAPFNTRPDGAQRPLNRSGFGKDQSPRAAFKKDGVSKGEFPRPAFGKGGFGKGGFGQKAAPGRAHGGGFKQAGAGGFRSRSDQPFSSGAGSSRPSSPRSGSSGGLGKKPRWIPRAGSSSPGTDAGPGARPGAGGVRPSVPQGRTRPAGKFGFRPAGKLGDKPAFGRKPHFGARAGGSGPDARAGGRPDARPGAKPGGQRGGGRSGFGKKPGQRPGFGKDRPRPDRGDFPKRKRPE